MILYSEDENAALLLATCLNPEANEGGMLLLETPAEVKSRRSDGSDSMHSLGGSYGSYGSGNSVNTYSSGDFRSFDSSNTMHGSDSSDGFSSHSGSSSGSDSLGNSYNYGNTCDAVNTAPSSRELILRALSEHRSQREAAAALHISRTTLWRRMKELGIDAHTAASAGAT